jgi:dipeptidyl aminopeptidase/acylaminoacyl peptidase
MSQKSLIKIPLKILIVLIIIFTLIIILSKPLNNSFKATILLLDLFGPEKIKHINLFRDKYLFNEVIIKGSEREISADLYRPDDGKRHAGLIFVHGLTPDGKDDTRLIPFIKSLVRSGFVVFVPEFLGMKSQKVRVSDIDEVIESFEYLYNLTDCIYKDKLGIMGFSYGVGPTLLAASDEEIRDLVKFVFCYGGYYDLKNVINYVTTGYYEYKNESGYLKPDEHGKWLFIKLNLDLIKNESDRKILKEISNKKLEDTKTNVDDLKKKLGKEGLNIYELLTNDDYKKVENLIYKLNLDIKEYIEKLSPSSKIENIKSYLLITHGYPDFSIPHTESIRLADSVGKENCHLAILKIIGHTEALEIKLTLKNIFTFYIPEFFKGFLIVYDLINQQN